MVDLTESHYSTGTATVAAGGTAVTGQGTNWAGSVRPGDLFGTHVGLPIRILSVDSNTSLTLAHEWPGAAQTAAAYEIQLTPYDVGYRKAIEDLVTRISEGNLPLLASLVGAANKLPYFDSSASMAVTDISEFARNLLDDANAGDARETIGLSEDISTTPLAPLQVGTRDVSNSVDSMVLVSRVAGNDVATNGHAFSDSSELNRGQGPGTGYAYNSFDARCDIAGPYDYDHYAGFQSRPNLTHTGTIQNLYDLRAVPIVNGHTVRRIGLEVRDPNGSGLIDTNYGVYVANLARGTKNWGVYTEGSTPSFFGSMPETGVEGRKIVERGSNANGTYIRFADGTQICWNGAAVTGANNIATGSISGLYWTGVVPMTFPVSFSETGSLAVWIINPPANRWVSGATSITTTGCGGACFAAATSASTYSFGFAAIGRWF